MCCSPPPPPPTGAYDSKIKIASKMTCDNPLHNYREEIGTNENTPFAGCQDIYIFPIFPTFNIFPNNGVHDPSPFEQKLVLW
ncbi:Protein CBG16126 [Caenorhabditis briggsae]|uniref:Protein CBG16126 n=1 Tax=Caenorhabditis briggsae TaxID=6238 RepID=A8XP21_CAEBR|nr:Protein CBG16126 [Caenorhabditis briggsae]CAP34261.2 Protein CBG16126 [Caenorhabditis briggsae]